MRRLDENLRAEQRMWCQQVGLHTFLPASSEVLSCLCYTLASIALVLQGHFQGSRQQAKGLTRTGCTCAQCEPGCPTTIVSLAMMPVFPTCRMPKASRSSVPSRWAVLLQKLCLPAAFRHSRSCDDNRFLHFGSLWPAGGDILCGPVPQPLRPAGDGQRSPRDGEDGGVLMTTAAGNNQLRGYAGGIRRTNGRGSCQTSHGCVWLWNFRNCRSY